MKLPRPYIPLSVCVQVAERQVEEKGSLLWLVYCSAQEISPWPLGRRLRVLLNDLFGDQHYQLDHDPALILRKFRRDQRRPQAAWFIPNANDPNHLVYRLTTDHLQKTTGRKAGAERTITTKGSDAHLAAKFRKLEGKNKPKRKSIIPSRQFSTQKRKFR